MRTYILFTIISILATVGIGLVSVHPNEADSNAAAWLDLVGLSSWGEGFTAATDEQIKKVLWIILAVSAVLIIVRWVRRKFIVAKAPNPQRTELDRQPINQAYAYLMEVRVFKEDGHELLSMRIAGLLKQAALDGADNDLRALTPSLVPVERQTPILLAIDRDFWRHHGD